MECLTCGSAQGPVELQLDAELAAAWVERELDCAIGVKRTAKVMAAAGQGRYSWVPAVGEEDTELF